MTEDIVVFSAWVVIFAFSYKYVKGFFKSETESFKKSIIFRIKESEIALHSSINKLKEAKFEADQSHVEIENMERETEILCQNLLIDFKNLKEAKRKIAYENFEALSSMKKKEIIINFTDELILKICQNWPVGRQPFNIQTMEKFAQDLVN